MWHWGAFMQPLLQWKSNKYYTFWAFICSFLHPACNAHLPYFHLWPAQLWNIFPLHLINGKIFRKKVTEHKTCVLIFSTTFVWNISHSKKKWVRNDKKCISVHVLYPLFVSNYNETWIFLTFLKNTQISYFMKIHPVGAQLFQMDGKMDRHDKAKSPSLQFCEHP